MDALETQPSDQGRQVAGDSSGEKDQVGDDLEHFRWSDVFGEFTGDECTGGDSRQEGGEQKRKSGSAIGRGKNKRRETK